MRAAILTLSGMCSIFVNIVNHRLADGGVNWTCGNNMTQRMLLFTAFRWHFRTGRVRWKNRKAFLVTQAACIWMKLQNVVTQSHDWTPSLPISHLTCYSKVRPSITLVFSLPSDWDGRVLFPWPPATRHTENQTLYTLSQWNNLTAHSQLEMCYEWMMHLYEWLWKILLKNLMKLLDIPYKFEWEKFRVFDFLNNQLL